MFDALSDRLEGVFRKIRGTGRITEAIAELQKAQNNPNRRIPAIVLLATMLFFCAVFLSPKRIVREL